MYDWYFKNNLCGWILGQFQLFNSVQSLSRVQLFATPCTTARQSSLSVTNSQSLFRCPLSRWCYPTILSSVVPFSPCLQSFPASGSFPMSQFFASGGQSIGVSASASVLPMNIQDWFPLGWTGWISLQSKGFSRVSNTTVQKHQLFGAHITLWSNSHPSMTTSMTSKTIALTIQTFADKVMSLLSNILSRFAIVFFPRSIF